jgi:hypothetical protein
MGQSSGRNSSDAAVSNTSRFPDRIPSTNPHPEVISNKRKSPPFCRPVDI